MEVTWYGRTCIRLRGKEAVVVTDPYPSVVGPTGRGITGDIVTFSHPDDAKATGRGKPKGRLSRDGITVIPSSLHDAFVLDGMSLHVDASIGIAVCPDHGRDRSLLLARAESRHREFAVRAEIEPSLQADHRPVRDDPGFCMHVCHRLLCATVG